MKVFDSIHHRLNALLWRLGTQSPVKTLPDNIEEYATYDEALAAAARHAMSNKPRTTKASQQPDGTWHLKVIR